MQTIDTNLSDMILNVSSVLSGKCSPDGQTTCHDANENLIYQTGLCIHLTLVIKC